MNPRANNPVSVNGGTAIAPFFRHPIGRLANVLAKLGLLRHDADYHLLRVAMVIIFFSSAIKKWFAYEAERLVVFISNGPLIFWLYPAFGMRGATLRLRMGIRCDVLLWVSGASAPRFSALLVRPERSSRPSRSSPSCPRAGTQAPAAFPAMTGNVPFLMKDVVLLAASLCLLKQEVQRSLLASAIVEPVRS